MCREKENDWKKARRIREKEEGQRKKIHLIHKLNNEELLI